MYYFFPGAIIHLVSVKHSAKSLNIYGSESVSTGQNICLYKTCTADPMQNWKVIPSGTNNELRLHSTLDDQYVLSRSTASPAGNAQIANVTNTNNKNSAVEFLQVSGDIYRVKLVEQNLYLTAATTASASPKTVTDIKANGNVYWSAATNDDCQKWTVRVIYHPSFDEETQVNGVDIPELLKISTTLEALQNSANNIRFIGRYYCKNDIPKLLKPNQAAKIHAAGFKIISVYQDENSAPEHFSYSIGTGDAGYAYDRAKEAEQPRGTTIYFAVDFDPTSTQIADNIIPYFRAIQNKFQSSYNNYYKIGVYGSGAVCKKIKQELQIATHSWLAKSTGYAGTSEYNSPDKYDIKQGAYCNYNGYRFDENVSGNNPDFGQW